MYKPNININNLEKYLDKDTLKIQYEYYLDKINKLNSLINADDLVNLITKEDVPFEIRDKVYFYVSAILNHELYFKSLGKKIDDKLRLEIIKDFGSLQNFKNEFIKSGLTLIGSGYVFLVRNDNKLQIINTSNEDTPYYYNFIPIIAIDLWEHAYILKYGLNKEQYISNFVDEIL